MDCHRDLSQGIPEHQYRCICIAALFQVRGCGGRAFALGTFTVYTVRCRRYKRMSKQEKEALWAEDRAQQRFVTETLVNGSRRYMGIQDSTVLEASSIGRLTRTLSAAALGNNGQGEPGMDRNASWGQDLMTANYMVSINHVC